MSNSKFVPAEQVTLINDKGTRIRVAASLASRMRGFAPVSKTRTAAATAPAAEGLPSESWTVKQLTAYAAANMIDLAGATRKDDILDVLAATADPDNDPDADGGEVDEEEDDVQDDEEEV
jgi:hypothetical protein